MEKWADASEAFEIKRFGYTQFADKDGQQDKENGYGFVAISSTRLLRQFI